MSKRTEKFLVLITDFITINLAGLFFFYLRVESGWFELIIQPDLFLPLLAIYFYWLIIFTFVGMYRTWFAMSRFDELSTLFKASFVGIFLLFSIILYDDYARHVESSNRFYIFFYWGIFLSMVGIGRLAIRTIQRKLLIMGIGRHNGLIIGYNDKAKEVHTSIQKYKELGIDIVGYVAAHPDEKGKSYRDIKVLDSISNLESVVEKNNVKMIIISLGRNDEDLITEVIERCDGKNIGIKMIPDLYDIISGQAKISQLYAFPLIDVMPELMPEWEKKLKRLMDIVLSFTLLVLSSPVTFLTAILIKIDSKGPVFYKQERMGLNGKIFKVVKFRTMYTDAEKHTGPIWSTKDDPRITKIGKYARKFRLDEIPQVYNVLKGDMSFVGPRPERPFFVEKLSKEIPLYKRRLKVRPGITGWAQVKHKYDETIEDVKVKLRYDLFYIENMSLRMDFKIILRTFLVVLFGKGHYE